MDLTKRIEEHKRYVQEATENAATEEERKQIISETLKKLSNKRRVRNA